MDFGYWIGFVGIGFGIAVPIPQILKIRRTGRIDGISLQTYLFLCCALVCYLIHAIYIQSVVFTIAQSVNITTNSIILGILWRRKVRDE